MPGEKYIYIMGVHNNNFSKNIIFRREVVICFFLKFDMGRKLLHFIECRGVLPFSVPSI